MKLTDRAFLKTGIDLAPLGVLMQGPFEPYFCTPKGARIFAGSGVDGIHFCFVRGFGETVFAVSPMNGRDGCVHPVAKSFRDFLRLLLALHDAAAIEQAWQWNAAQLEDFEQKHPSDAQQKAVLDEISHTFRLRPMAEPWKYIHTVQSGFDYGKLRFSEEFYEMVEDTAGKLEPWKVTFEGGFGGGKGPAGKQLTLGKTFFWGEDEWIVPAAYVCREGIVLDICERVLVRTLCSFREKWELTPENDGSDWEIEKCIRARAENPFEGRFSAELTVNGQTLREKRGCALCWDPLYPEGNDRENKQVRERYGLDELDGWYISRISFSWKDKKQTVKSMSLCLCEDLLDVPGPEFTPEKAGDAMTFYLPRDPQTYTITAREMEDKTLDFFGQTLYTTALRYTITPEPPEGSLTLRDYAEPIRLSDRGSSIGVIGGVSGIAAFGRGKDIVCSQVRREEKRRVTWTLVFHEKRKEDIEITLLEEKKEQRT